MPIIICILISVVSSTLCVSSEVLYSKDQEHYFDHIKIRELDEGFDFINLPQNVITSKNKERVMYDVPPDAMIPGPWTHVVYVVPPVGHAFKIECTDVDSGLVHATWINNKYIHLEVWIGRIVALETIINVENHLMITQDVANYRPQIIK